MRVFKALKHADFRSGHNNCCINTAARGSLERNFKFNARPHCTLNKLPFRHFFSSGVSVNGPNFDAFRNKNLAQVLSFDEVTCIQYCKLKKIKL